MTKILKHDDAVDMENVVEGVADKWRWQWVKKIADVDSLNYPKITRSDTITIFWKIASGKLIDVEKLSIVV